MAKKKKRGHSWLTAVKSWAFRSPPPPTPVVVVKQDSLPQNNNNKAAAAAPAAHDITTTTGCCSDGDAAAHHQDQKQLLEKREKRSLWLFNKKPPSSNSNSYSNNNATSNTAKGGLKKETRFLHTPPAEMPAADQKHAIAVAAAAAEAAVATAQAAVEIIRLTTRSSTTPLPLPGGGGLLKKNEAAAALVIQTAFRGYLARRALVALRGIVKLQALIRGQNMRKQADKTLKYMHALLRVQARVREQQARLSHDPLGSSGGRKSMSQLGDYRNVGGGGEIAMRKSMSNSHERSYSSILDEWSRYPPTTLEDLEASLQARKDALEHESRSASSDQLVVRKNYDSTNEDEEDERTSWVDKYWTANKQRDSFGNSTQKTPDSIKTLRVDTAKQYNSFHSPAATNTTRRTPSPNQKQATPASPRQRYLQNLAMLQQLTPSPSRNKQLHVRSSSPRRIKEDKSYSTANSPSIRTSFSSQRLKFNTIPECRDSGNDGDGAPGTLPNYMAATESAKARLRSQSAPRQRPSTPERERLGLAKKRLSYPVPEPGYCISNGDYCYSTNLRSPSFKSLQAGYIGMEQHSCQSCYTDSIGGETSPCSTTDLRRWLR